MRAAMCAAFCKARPRAALTAHAAGTAVTGALQPRMCLHHAAGCAVRKKPDAAEREGMPMTVSKLCYETQLIARPKDPSKGVEGGEAHVYTGPCVGPSSSSTENPNRSSSSCSRGSVEPTQLSGTPPPIMPVCCYSC